MTRSRWAALGLACLAACSGGGGTDAPTPPPAATVVRVVVTPPDATLLVGDTLRLRAEAFTATNTPVPGRPVAWTSGSPATVSVSSSGLVTALAAGGVTITATIDGVTGSATVTVRSFQGMTVTPASFALAAGSTRALTVEVRDARGAIVPNPAVTFSSTAPSVASVSTAGVVTGIAPGTAIVTATSGTMAASAQVTVTASLIVLPDSATVTTIGGQVAATVTLNGQAVGAATFAVMSEGRYLHDRAVLDSAQLAAGRIVAAGAGRAVVRVSAAGLSDTIIVQVVPSQPHMFSVTGPGGRTHVGSADTLVVRAYRAQHLTTATLQPASLGGVVIGVDSATARVVMPTLVTATCTGRAPQFTPGFTGATASPVPPFTRRRSAEISLVAGESRRLSAAEQACLRFAPAGGARYLLAYVDGRLTEKAKAQPEWPWPDSIHVTLADQGSTTPSQRALPPWLDDAGVTGRHGGLGLPGSAETTLAVPTGCPFLNTWFPFCRSTPWQVGELITHYPQFSNLPPQPARIIASRGNLVLGIVQADSAQLPAGALARADSAMQVMAQRGIPFLQSIFGLGAPTTTSDESGQLYMMLEASTSPGGASWYADPPTGHGRWGRITFGLSPNTAFGLASASFANPLIIIAHEVLHTYQFRWRYQFAAPWLTYLGTSWAVEGGATFYSIEMVREALGVPFLGNQVFNAASSSDPRAVLGLYGSRVGDFTYGYQNASGFLRDLVQRLVGAGMTFDAAMREVLAGAMEGWYGINEEGQQRGLGLTARMRARLGASWNPNDALLDWTMSEAADDQTANARFQNLTARMAQPSPASSPFVPHAIIAPGAALTVLRTPGSTGVFEIRDDVGGSYRASAAVKGVPNSQVEWLALRIR